VPLVHFNISSFILLSVFQAKKRYIHTLQWLLHMTSIAANPRCFQDQKPRCLVLKNFDQLVEHQKTMYPIHGFAIDLSEKLFLSKNPKDFHLLNLERFSSILFDWPNYKYSSTAIRESIKQFETIFQFQNFPNVKSYPNVKRLVLVNFIYSSGMIRCLKAIFTNLESLVITYFNCDSDFCGASFKNFTTIDHLEIKLPASKAFGFDLPIGLKTVGIDIQKSEDSEDGYRNKQTIRASHCTLLKTVNIRKNGYNPHGDEFEFEPPTCIEFLTFDADRDCTFESDFIWTLNVKIIHFSYSHSFGFISKPDDRGIRTLDETMCPNCVELGLINKFGEVRVLWKKVIVATPIIMTLT